MQALTKKSPGKTPGDTWRTGRDSNPQLMFLHKLYEHLNLYVYGYFSKLLK